MTANDSCIRCGMPMRPADEHAAKVPTKPYYLHCAKPSGEMKSHDEVLVGFAAFLTRTQGVDPAVARQSAKDMMAKLPAWQK